MAFLGDGYDSRRHWCRLVGLGLTVALSVLALMLGPALASMIQSHLEVLLPRRVRVWEPLAFLVVATVFVWIRPTRFAGERIAERSWAALDRASSWLLRFGLPWTVAACSLVLWACWVPHYVTLPLGTDPDQFAVSAQAWDVGILPYRDLPDFDFPGPIYLFWVLGKLFGWGKSVAFFAVDAGLLLLLGVALVAWSIRRFGRTLPGWIGFLSVLTYYLPLNYALVAERDWHVALCGVIGVLAIEMWPGVVGSLASAALMAIALAYRPQAVLFLPGFFWAVASSGWSAKEPRLGPSHALVSWSALLGIAIFLAFTPLIFAGVADDFVRVLQVTRYGGPYNRVTESSFVTTLGRELTHWRTIWPLTALGLLATVSRRFRRPALTWLLVLLGVLVYKPMSPIPHDYLDEPVVLVGLVGVAFLLGCLMQAETASDSLRLLLTVAVLVEIGWSVPDDLLRLDESSAALRSLVRGEPTTAPPPGCRTVFQVHAADPSGYSWLDYQRTLEYLRRSTSPTTKVADFLRNYPYPTINGSVGRLSPFPAAGGVLWLSWVNPGDEDRFVRSLEQADNSVVVWNPRATRIEPALRLERLEQVIRRRFEREAAFGSIEVWRLRDRRAASPKPPPEARPGYP